ncbi:hypothetical protein, partial [Klebsiella pneumoniae]
HGLAQSTTKSTNSKGRCLLVAQTLLASGVLLIVMGLAGFVLDRGALPPITALPAAPISTPDA